MERLAKILGVAGAIAAITLSLSACSAVGVRAAEPTPSPTITQSDEPAAAPAPAPKSAEQRLDESMKLQGYEVGQSGNVYVKFANPSDFSCGQFNCIGVQAYVEKGCPSMLYIEANVLSGGAVVGMANKSPGAVPPGSPVAFLLEDYQGIGDAFRFSKVSCY